MQAGRTLVLMCCALLVGCPKDKKGGETTATAPTSATPERSAGKAETGIEKPVDAALANPPKDDKPAMGSVRAMAGVDVPTWTKPNATKPACRLTGDQKKVLDKLNAGDDPTFDDGTADARKLVADMIKDCTRAGATVGNALDAGGRTRFAQKKYAEANRWWARALVVDPTNTFARYDLACGLALEGKKEDALWNLQQLLEAAKGEDPRAVHSLRKAKSDESLASIRGDDGFKKTLDAAEALEAAGAVKCAAPEVPGKDDKGKVRCLQICSTYGTAGGCATGTVCMGASSFGDSFVPFCKSAEATCAKGEKPGPVWIEGVGVGPEECLRECSTDADCTKGRKCGGPGGIPTLYGLMWGPACVNAK